MIISSEILSFMDSIGYHIYEINTDELCDPYIIFKKNRLFRDSKYIFVHLHLESILIRDDMSDVMWHTVYSNMKSIITEFKLDNIKN